MATITVEGIPAGLLLRLAAAAAANGRCLNSELIVHLARSAGAGTTAAGWANRAQARTRCCDAGGCRCRGIAVEECPTGWGGPAAQGAAPS